MPHDEVTHTPHQGFRDYVEDAGSTMKAIKMSRTTTIAAVACATRIERELLNLSLLLLEVRDAKKT